MVDTFNLLTISVAWHLQPLQCLLMVLHCAKPIIEIIINNASLVKPAQTCSKYICVCKASNEIKLGPCREAQKSILFI